MTAPALDGRRVARSAGLEGRAALLLRFGTYLAMALIAAGTALMLGAGGSPLDVASRLDPGRLVQGMLSLRPDGFLWAGLLVVLVTPAARVALSLLGFAREGERAMAVVAALILMVVVSGVIVGTAAG